jgi:Protein of unknown function (DUF3999)
MRKIILALLAGFVSLVAFAADAPLKPTDFAYGMALQTDGKDGVYKVSVPLDVYKVVRHADLRDVRVFNADGEVVPHVVTRSSGSVSVKSEPIELPRFPVYASAQSKLGDLDLQIKRDSQGTVINLNNRSSVAGQNQLVGYLLDGNKVGPAVKEIELQWSESIANYVGSVTVEASDDLATWRTLAKDAPITRMKFGDHLLEQRRVKFTPTPLIYLRISGSSSDEKDAPLPELTRVLAIPADMSAEAPRTWSTIVGKPVATKPGEYEFDMGAQVPIDRVHIELPQMNTLVQAELHARANEKEAWQSVAQTTVYRLTQNGRQFNSDDIQINRDGRRHWLLRIAQQGGGLGKDNPSLKVGWLADQILFLARGRGPFQFAYGADGVKSGEVPIATLMTTADDKGGIQAQSVNLGSPSALGGDARLARTPDPFPWKKWTLWAVLGIGVILMGWMASRLMGQMNEKKS